MSSAVPPSAPPPDPSTRVMPGAAAEVSGEAVAPADGAAAQHPLTPIVDADTRPADKKKALRWRMPRLAWTLRQRLLVGIVAAVTLVSIAIGFASVLVLNGYLTNRVDAQLVSLVSRSLGGGQGSGGRPDQFLLQPGSPLGSIAATFSGGALTQAQALGLEGVTSLTAQQTAALESVTVARTAATIDLGTTLGDYRAMAVKLPTGVELVVGLPLGDVQATVTQYRNLVALISAMGIIVVAFAATIIITLALRPLRRVAATATQVASLPLDRGEVSLAIRVPEADTDPRTEVGQVGAALNSMLGHVDAALTARQASENRVRQFVADASHELRTPLASIRGYAELTRRGNYTLPEDVTHSLGRVESEAVRMTSLVEDLLLLARLDDGRELESKPVELSRLLVDCVSDAGAAGPDHDWVLDIPEESVLVSGDHQRIHQVLANLLTNARVHTPAGTTVTAGITVTERDTAVITIEDNGPGIPHNLLPDLFERFARGDTSRSRVAGSTGLGLSIVRAVVDAHGGDVTVDSEPGRTVFRVELPGVL